MKNFTAPRTRIGLQKSAVAVAMLSILGMSGAYAAGTDAGQIISNTATVSYSVNSVPQTDVSSAPAQFVVDRKIDMNITQTGVTTQPNTNNVATTFLVTNEGNLADSFTLHYAYVSGVDVSASLKLYFDTDGSGTFNAGDTLVANDTVVAFAKDETRRYFVVADIPGTATNGQTSVVSLTATTTTPATPPGADNPNVVEVVYAEGAGPTYDGSLAANATYTIQSATLSVTKTAQVVSDPTGAVAPNAKAIPGAVVRYTIVVTNGGTLDATNVVLSDPIPANTTYQAGTIKLGVASLTDASDADAGAFNGTSVNVTAGNIAASGGTSTVTFDVAIN